MARFPLMILSFFLSLTLWVYVQNQEDPPKPLQTSFTLPIEFKNKPEALQIVNPVAPIKVFPVGPEDERKRIDPKNLSASVDLAKAVPGGASYPVRLNIDGDYAVRWEPRSPTIFLRLERVKTRIVPIVVQAVGQLGNTADFVYLAKETYTDPAEVKITGPEGDVDRVAYARAIVDLRTVARGDSYASEVDLVEGGDRPAAPMVDWDPHRVVIHPGIGVADLRLIRIRPLVTGTPSSGAAILSIEAHPDRIQLRGSRDALDALEISGVRTFPVDVTDVRESMSLSTSLDLPPDVTATASPTISVSVLVGPKPRSSGGQPRRAGG